MKQKIIHERQIEHNWVISKILSYQEINNKFKVLDTGAANMKPVYIKFLNELNAEIYVLDIIPFTDKIPFKNKTVHDLRQKTNFVDNYFDIISCISTLEHIGCDISQWTKKKEVNQDKLKGQQLALKEMYRILKPKGKLLITVPYGAFQDEGWLINFNNFHMVKVLNILELPLNITVDFYIYKKETGFIKCKEEDLSDKKFREPGCLAASGLACICITK